MLSSNIYRRIMLGLIFGPVLLSSCNRHYTVSGNQYKEYAIDQSAGTDSSLVKYYLPYKKQMDAEMNRVIGRSDQELTKTSDPETLMGDFFSDAILAEGLKKDPTIQFTLSTKGGLRTSFPKGNISVSNVFELMPFENELVVLKLSGASVQKVIDFIVKSNGQPVAGIRMNIRDKKATDVMIAGKPFDINQSYNLLTYDYLANGAEGLEFLSEAAERKNIDKKVRDALIDHINGLTSAGKTINTQLDGRIVVNN
ncbi:5'-nucleotidase C-terminal domain-containing protein [Dyadobacter sp. CY356]|uniref:5'-nucleotidase C-terminal domain-containing protein n=1 Tax=Dyadobacter sp. CY356 TaxID=2906442 RepID=UPI001F480B50|nr:5'-nucleotidase [Dyadobacter sp. CY356]